jgi:hypothetical protein
VVVFLRALHVLKDTRAKDGQLLRISVLGRLAVLRDGMRLQLPPSKKTRALLAYRTRLSPPSGACPMIPVRPCGGT